MNQDLLREVEDLNRLNSSITRIENSVRKINCFDEEQLSYVNKGLDRLHKELPALNILALSTVCKTPYFSKYRKELTDKLRPLSKLMHEIEMLALNNQQ
jgi:DNA-directed RNA polymerase alpha subunit